jgi:hypothetical protein
MQKWVDSADHQHAASGHIQLFAYLLGQASTRWLRADRERPPTVPGEFIIYALGPSPLHSRVDARTTILRSESRESADTKIPE